MTWWSVTLRTNMADLTSIIRITGTIGGRTLNFSHTYTLEDVYDVVQTSADPAGSTLGTIGNNEEAGQEAIMPQAGFDYLFFRNNSPQHYSGIGLNATSKSVQLVCSPNQFGILCSNATGETYGATATLPATLIDPESVSLTGVVGVCNGSVSVLAAYNAST